MHNADRAVLRIGTGIGLATGLCYGLALPMPHLGVIMAWVVLCRPGEPLGLKKGLAGGILLLGIMASGVLLVPLLTHYALAAVLLVGLLLYLLMQQATALQMHPKSIIVCDDAATAELKVGTYKYFLDIEKNNLDPDSLL
jgi:hypothetical protein